MLDSGSVRVKVVAVGEAATRCERVPMSSRGWEDPYKHLELYVEQAATGLSSGSPLTRFLSRNKEAGSSWLLSQNVGGSDIQVCGRSRRTAAGWRNWRIAADERSWRIAGDCWGVDVSAGLLLWCRRLLRYLRYPGWLMGLWLLRRLRWGETMRVCLCRGASLLAWLILGPFYW